MEVPERIKVELSRKEKPLGTITFWNGELDFADVDPAPDRESLRRVFAEYREKPPTYVEVGRTPGEETPHQHEPTTVAWFKDVLRLVLGPEGYRYKELEGGTRPPRDNTSEPGGA
jgi:hypothetical protein